MFPLSLRNGLILVNSLDPEKICAPHLKLYGPSSISALAIKTVVRLQPSRVEADAVAETIRELDGEPSAQQ